MARVSLSLTVTSAVLFFFLTLCHARIPAILPAKYVVVGGELPNSSPDSDVGPIISLPSDNVNADPVGETKESEQPVAVSSVPLTLARSRPVNRHFLFRSRFPSRPCHHHRHNSRLFKPLMRQQVEVSYGDDIILSSGENGDFVDPMMFHPGVQRIPARWVRFHHHHHSHHRDDEDDNRGSTKFVFKHSDKFGKEKFKKHLRHENEEGNEEERHVENVKNHEDGGFMTRIRKILDHF